MPRRKRKATEIGSSSAPSSDDRFPTENHRIKFHSLKYKPLPSRYLDRAFFSTSCIPSIEVISHYRLDRLVYCSTDPNIDRCSEFYNNLVQIDDLHFSSKVASQPVLLSPEILNSHLGLLTSQCTFVCLPPGDLPFGDPYTHITTDTIYTLFLGEHWDTTTKWPRSAMLRIQDYVLYRVIVNCILPISSRDLAVMRPCHSFLLYAFVNRLELDLGLLLFHSIIQHARLVTSSQVHMPYCHILTTYFASLGIDVTVGQVRPLVEFDKINMRHFTLAKIGIDSHHSIYWKRDRGEDDQEIDEEADQDHTDQPDAANPYIGFDLADLDAIPPTPPPPPAPTVDERLARIEARLDRQDEMLHRLQQEHTARHQEQVQHFDQRIDRLTDLVERLVSRFSDPPPSTS